MTMVWEAARAAAKELRAEYGTDDPFELGRALGIDFYVTPMPDGSSGMIVKRDGEDPEIFIEASDPEVRRRFTMAHEIGHYVERDQAGDRDFSFRERRGMDYDLHEFFADEFAGELLMPEDVFVPLMTAGATNTALAARFNVSVAAVERRRARLMKSRS